MHLHFSSKEKICLSLLIASVMHLRLSMQEEDIWAY